MITKEEARTISVALNDVSSHALALLPKFKKNEKCVTDSIWDIVHRNSLLSSKVRALASHPACVVCVYEYTQPGNLRLHIGYIMGTDAADVTTKAEQAAGFHRIVAVIAGHLLNKVSES